MWWKNKTNRIKKMIHTRKGWIHWHGMLTFEVIEIWVTEFQEETGSKTEIEESESLGKWHILWFLQENLTYMYRKELAQSGSCIGDSLPSLLRAKVKQDLVSMMFIYDINYNQAKAHTKWGCILNAFQQVGKLS